jgi:hypothetical protein
MTSERLPRKLAAVLYADIAARIATALEPELSPSERASIGKRPTKSTEAYALDLEARSLNGTEGTAERMETYWTGR